MQAMNEDRVSVERFEERFAKRFGVMFLVSGFGSLIISLLSLESHDYHLAVNATIK